MSSSGGDGLKRRGMFFFLVGPAGGGKTTLAKRLLADHGDSLKLSVSATTRQPREGEREGESYFFMSRDEFQRRDARGELFEWEEIHGQLYGTLKQTVDDALSAGLDLLLPIDIKGALNFKSKLPNQVVVVFLLPPSAEVMRTRIMTRGSVTPEELERRLDTARHEYKHLMRVAEDPRAVDYCVVNEDIESAYAAVRSIFSAERHRLCRIDSKSLQKICVLT